MNKYEFIKTLKSMRDCEQIKIDDIVYIARHLSSKYNGNDKECKLIPIIPKNVSDLIIGYSCSRCGTEQNGYYKNFCDKCGSIIRRQ